MVSEIVRSDKDHGLVGSQNLKMVPHDPCDTVARVQVGQASKYRQLFHDINVEGRAPYLGDRTDEEMFVQICEALQFSERAGGLAGARVTISYIGLGELDAIKILLGIHRPGDIVIGFEKYAFLPKKRRPKGFRQRYDKQRWKFAWEALSRLAKARGVTLVLKKMDVCFFPFVLADTLKCSVWDLPKHVGRLVFAADTCNMNDANHVFKLWEKGEACYKLRDRTILESNVAAKRGGLSFDKTHAQALKCCGPEPRHLGGAAFPRRESPQGETREMRTWCSPLLYNP